MTQIFISYRHHDTAFVADLLCDKLKQHFGRDSVFLDVDNIPFGVDFRKHIGDEVGRCDALLVVIGEQWVRAVDGQGNRRIDDPADYVRIEIEAALRRDIIVIPVLVEDTVMPSEADLPPSIQQLAYRNVARIRAGRDRHQQVELLIQDVESELNRRKNKATPDKKLAPRKSKATPKKKSAGGTEQPLAPGLNRAKAVKLIRKVYLIKEIRDVLKKFSDKKLFVGDAIPPDKLKNAISAYAPNVSPEDVLLLYDNTFFGGAKDGLLLTTDAARWRNKDGECGQRRYSEIESVEFVKGFFNPIIRINGEEGIDIDLAENSNKLGQLLTHVIRAMTTPHS
jgi:hypothetical protein